MFEEMWAFINHVYKCPLEKTYVTKQNREPGIPIFLVQVLLVIFSEHSPCAEQGTWSYKETISYTVRAYISVRSRQKINVHK